MAIYVVVAVTAAVEHQPHQTAANHEGENDAEDHSYVAMNAHLYVDTVPSTNSPPEGDWSASLLASGGTKRLTQVCRSPRL
jgi:hypothetical protein